MMSGSRADKAIEIRRATLRDVPLITHFIKEIARFERLIDEVSATEAVITETLFGEEPAARVIFAEAEGKPIGYAVYFFNFSTFTGRPGLYIEDIFVYEEYRGMGAGEAMMKYLAHEAKTKDCGRMEWAVLDWNPARKFYERFGAESLDDWLLYRLSGEALDDLAGG
jgi:GNAT superfamily N-acetyltransferase